MKKIVLLAFVLLLLSTAVVVGLVRPVADSLPVLNIGSGKVTAQTVSTTMVYLDPPTINGTEIGVGNNVTVNLNISDAVDIFSWQAGLIFNATLLECTGFFEGGFLSNFAGSEGTSWIPATINNTAGLIGAAGCTLIGDYKASGSGRLAYLTFEVKELGVSDLHLRDVMVQDYYDPLEMVPFNIIDVYTIIVNATAHKVVTVSNSTGVEAKPVWDEEAGEWIWVWYHSGFYDHAFNASAEEVSFKVTGPYPGFSNVTIPKALLEPEPSHRWGVIIDGNRLSVDERTITENATHTSIHFTYSASTASQLFHNVQITTRFIPSTISMTLSETSVTVGSNITISGAIAPVRPSVNVTIQSRRCGGTWTKVATVKTNLNSNYSYTWTPEKAGIYEVMATWEGDENTLGNESGVQTLTVKGVVGRVHNISTTFDYPTIKEAIDACETLDGHTILVDADIYYEHVNIKKSISLIGENKSTTIIDGSGIGTVIYMKANNASVSGFTIRNGSVGIQLDIYGGNTITGNTILNNTVGVSLYESGGNIFRDNNITGSEYNFYVWGESLPEFIQDIDVSNTVDGKPIYYLLNQTNLIIDPSTLPEIGYLALVNSINVTVRDITLTNKSQGILFAFTTYSNVENVNASDNYLGIHFIGSDRNTLSNNTLSNNLVGIGLEDSMRNTMSNNTLSNNYCGTGIYLADSNVIFHNNFINNTNQVLLSGSYYNVWDNGYPSGGNYWSDYTGVDLYSGPNQDQLGSDGIRDKSHVIDVDNQDRYPLMGPINFFSAGTWNETIYYVDTVSNSTVTDFYFNPQEGASIKFNVTGSYGTTGFCRITIPNELIWCDSPDQWKVWVNNTLIEDRKITEDTDYTYIYFTYNHSTQNVEVIGVHVIPEFPALTSMLPILIVLTVAIAVYKRRLLKTPIR